MYRKNVANQSLFFALVNATTGAPMTGASVTVYRALGTTAQTLATGTVSEMGNGQYRFNLSQADTNGDNGSFLFIATNAVPVEKTIVFTTANPTDSATFGLSKFGDIESDTQDIQSRIPVALVSGRMDASVGLMQANTLTASALAADAVTEIQAGLATSAQATAIESDTQNIQSRLPAALVSGRIDAHVGTAAATDIASEVGYQFSVLAGDWANVPAVIADSVWDENYADHTTAGTFGKLMDTIRKANTVIDGVVTSAISPTTTSFSTTVNYPTGAFKHAVLVWLDGSGIAEQNSPILTYVNTDGVVTVEEAFTAAPQVGDEFIIIPTTHVHAIAAIQAGLATTTQLTDVENKVDALGGTGVGSFTVSLTVKLSNGNTVGDCDVSLTTSSTSSTTNLVATGRTDPNGNVTFQLDSGVFYVWRQRLGVNFDDPAVLTVAGDGSATVS